MRTVTRGTASAAMVLSRGQSKKWPIKNTATPSNINITESHNVTVTVEVGGNKTIAIAIAPAKHVSMMARMMSPRLCHGLLFEAGRGGRFLARFPPALACFLAGFFATFLSDRVSLSFLSVVSTTAR